MPNGREAEAYINDVKPYSTTYIVKNVSDSFLGSIKNQNNSYDLGPQP